jgi:hypothetical protein
MQKEQQSRRYRFLKLLAEDLHVTDTYKNQPIA